MRKKIDKRTKFIKKMISLLVELYKLSNFNACSEILVGLTLGPVARLNQTWATLKKKQPKTFTIFEEMQDLFSSQNNFEQYRNALAKCAPPCVPSFSLMMKELSYLDTLVNDTVIIEDRIYINVDKMAKLYAMAQNLDLYKQPYNLRPLEIIYSFLTTNLIYLEDTVLFDKSREIESPDDNDGKSVLVRDNTNPEKRTSRKSILIKEKEKVNKKKN